MNTTTTTKTIEIVTPTKAETMDSSAKSGTATATSSSNAPRHQSPHYGAIINLPLPMQVTFHRKLLAILALQLFVVGMATGLVETSSSLMGSVDDHLVSSGGSLVLLCAALVLSLLVLFFVRDKHPFNWVALFVFSALEVLGLLCIDAALDSHVAVVNCGFTFICMVLMILFTVWTSNKVAMDGTQGSVRSPYLLGSISFGITCALFVLCDQVVLELVEDQIELSLTLLAQFCVLFWFCVEIKGMHKAMTPDEYMRGVVYLYTDLLVLLAMAALCFMAGGDGTAGTLAFGYMPADALAYGALRDGQNANATGEENA